MGYHARRISGARRVPPPARRRLHDALRRARNLGQRGRPRQRSPRHQGQSVRGGYGDERGEQVTEKLCPVAFSDCTFPVRTLSTWCWHCLTDISATLVGTPTTAWRLRPLPRSHFIAGRKTCRKLWPSSLPHFPRGLSHFIIHPAQSWPNLRLHRHFTRRTPLPFPRRRSENLDSHPRPVRSDAPKFISTPSPRALSSPLRPLRRPESLPRRRRRVGALP